MLIAISGKAQSGKDTVGQIFQYLTTRVRHSYGFKDFKKNMNDITNFGSRYEIKKFADKLKDCVCIILGCTREQLEDIDFKNTELGEEWIRYGRADGFFQGGSQGTIMNNASCTKEEYEAELRINWQTAYKFNHTPRSILQMLGTEVGRFIHQNTWVNALFSEYDTIQRWKIQDKPSEYDKYPNWIITDWRFENEGKAILERKGITIRVERFIDLRHPKEWEEFADNVGDNPINEDYFMDYCKYDNPKLYNHLTHQSEIELDKHVGTDYFKYTIYNNGDIENLITQCYDILLKEKLI